MAKKGLKKGFKYERQNQDSKNKKGKCFNCNKYGHWKRDCPDKNRNRSTGGAAFIGENLFVAMSEENTWFVVQVTICQTRKNGSKITSSLKFLRA